MAIPNVAPTTPIASAWGNAVADAVNALQASPLAHIQSGLYVPALSGLATGTGGTPQNDADFVYVGGPNVGNVGIITVRWYFRFGTTGQTFPAGAVNVPLPPGFIYQSNLSSGIVGNVWFIDADASSNNRVGYMWMLNGGGNTRVVGGGHNSPLQSISASTPFTWAANDIMSGAWTASVLRI